MKLEFNEWLEAVRKLMTRTKIAKPDVVLDEITWAVYYNDGLNPFDTMIEEFGLGFKKKFINTSNP